MSQQRIEWAALVLRLGLGVVMLAHGLTKLWVFTLPGTAAFFESVGFPGLLAYPVTAIEIIGGASLIIGLQTRWAALLMLPVLLGASSVHLANGWAFNAPNGGWEYPVFLAVVALAQFVLGSDGALSVGAWLRSSRTDPNRRSLAAAA